MRSTFEGFRVEFESFDTATRLVRVRSAVGTFSAKWMADVYPEPGSWSYVEVDTEPTCVWGIDVTGASPTEPDSISETGDGWMFVGTVLGVDPDIEKYTDGGRFISQDDLSVGRFHLRIGNHYVTFYAEDLPVDAAGRRIRVRQTAIELFPC